MNNTDARELKRRIERLAAERVALFAHAGGGGTPGQDHGRLKAIERELDECYLAVRQSRAARDAERFVADGRATRARLSRNAPGRDDYRRLE